MKVGVCVEQGWCAVYGLQNTGQVAKKRINHAGHAGRLEIEKIAARAVKLHTLADYGMASGLGICSLEFKLQCSPCNQCCGILYSPKMSANSAPSSG